MRIQAAEDTMQRSYPGSHECSKKGSVIAGHASTSIACDAWGSMLGQPTEKPLMISTSKTPRCGPAARRERCTVPIL